MPAFLARAERLRTRCDTELARLGWPLTELEQSLLVPIYHAFRVDMALWAVHEGQRSGEYYLTHIERQLERTAVPCP